MYNFGAVILAGFYEMQNCFLVYRLKMTFLCRPFY